jgi:hypothetical protein
LVIERSLRETLDDMPEASADPDRRLTPRDTGETT